MATGRVSLEERARTRELVLRYCATRDVSLRDQLVDIHLNVVRFMAYKFVNRGEPYEDIYQVGCMALVKAIERFDPTQGAELTTFATPTIIGEIKRYFRDKGWAIRVPRRLQELKLQLARSNESLCMKLGRPPTIQEIAAELKISDERVLEIQELGGAYKNLSLDAEFQSEDVHSSSLMAYLGRPDGDMLRFEERTTIARAMTVLSRRQRLIIFLRFYQDQTQVQVAELMQTSQMHVSRTQKQALEIMRTALTAAQNHS